MGLFGKILEKLGFNKSAQAAEAPAASQGPAAQAPTATPAPSQAVSQVDVVAQLEAKAAANPQKLNWKESIVDLLKLLGLDSSLDARKELAVELGCPPEKMKDSAQLNLWLHTPVLQKLADNGGNIPPELLN